MVDPMSDTTTRNDEEVSAKEWEKTFSASFIRAFGIALVAAILAQLAIHWIAPGIGFQGFTFVFFGVVVYLVTKTLKPTLSRLQRIGWAVAAGAGYVAFKWASDTWVMPWLG